MYLEVHCKMELESSESVPVAAPSVFVIQFAEDDLVSYGFCSRALPCPVASQSLPANGAPITLAPSNTASLSHSWFSSPPAYACVRDRPANM